MTERDENDEVSIEPKFDELAEQEENRALRVKIVFGVVFGPAIVLLLLGYADAAGIALMFGFLGAFAFLWIMAKFDEMNL